MRVLTWAKRQFHRTIGEVLPCDNPALVDDPNVLHIGPRAYCRKVVVGGKPYLKKIFTTESPGREAFASERMAQRSFREMPWFQPWVNHGWNWYLTPMQSPAYRLDRIVEGLSTTQRQAVAGYCLSIILDLVVRGFAHRDFHAHNLFFSNGQLLLVDYETLTRYPDDQRPGLANCYDVTGTGISSPWRTGNMGYAVPHAAAVSTVLNVEFETARTQLATILKQQLHDASTTFQTRRQTGRHTCAQGRIYNAFNLPGLSVAPSEAQRDCRRRCDQLGISADNLRGKRVLDLGSNIGGMLFETQRFEPAECLGVEYDQQKVHISNRVAAFENLDRVHFRQADVDRATVRSLNGPYDVVLCLALEAHVKKPERLFRLLGRLTREVLFFEGNSTTDLKKVERQLRAAEFSRIEFLGPCDDDSLPENNCRPLLRALK